MKSKTGLNFMIIFIIITLLLDLYAIMCNEIFCSVFMMIPAIPWFWLFQGLMGDSWKMIELEIFLSQLVNVFVIYFIGAWIGGVISKSKKI